jgi:hypothetical protein
MVDRDLGMNVKGAEDPEFLAVLAAIAVLSPDLDRYPDAVQVSRLSMMADGHDGTDVFNTGVIQ